MIEARDKGTALCTSWGCFPRGVHSHSHHLYAFWIWRPILALSKFTSTHF